MSGVMVVGGGLAGAMAATVLAQRGLPVTLFERDRAPRDKVCGEFLTGEGCAALRAVGICPDALGAAPVERIRLATGRWSAEADLPFEARALPRLRLDPVLRGRAAAAGATLRLGASVRSVAPREVRLSAGERVDADAVVLATGKHELRGLRRDAPARAKVGFKSHLVLDRGAARGLARTVELHLFRGGYGGLMPLGDGRVTFSFVVEPWLFDAAGKTHAGVVAEICRRAPGLAQRLSGSAPSAAPQAVAAVPYGYRSWARPAADGLWRVGDQAAVTPSFTGAGMALALASGRLVAECLAEGRSAAEHRGQLGRRFGPQVRRAVLLDRLLAGPWAGAATALTALAPGTLSHAARLTRVA